MDDTGLPLPVGSGGDLELSPRGVRLGAVRGDIFVSDHQDVVVYR